MRIPQTKAQELANYSNKLRAIADNGCLAMCYLYCAGIDGDDVDYIINCARAMDEGYLGDDCYVKDAATFLHAFTGRNPKITKKTCLDISKIKDPTPVLFKAPGKAGHWVVVENGKIVFNSLINSYNVAKGKPAEMREIKWW